MIMSMELQRPRLTLVLPQWDLGIVPEALSKPPYEPLREASLKHLTLKTGYGFRRSKLQALVFDPQYIQFEPKGAGVTLYFKPEFGAPNCPVRALKYYHRYMSEHPELRKGRHCLFIPFKELSAAYISRWIF